MTIKARDLPLIVDMIERYRNLQEFAREKPAFSISFCCGQAFPPRELVFGCDSIGEADMRMALLELKSHIKRVLKEIYDVEID
jgi:hypothetical protein